MIGALVLIMFASLLTVSPAGAADEVRVVEPTEHFELMTSPGIGFQDFIDRVPSQQQLASCSYDTTVEDAGILGGSLYVRLLWRDLEPAEGEYAWPLLDRLFECAEQRDQTVDFRLMVSWPGAGDRDCWSNPSENDEIDHSIPCWLVRQGVNELEHDGAGGIPATYVPDWEDETIRTKHAQLIRAIGQRYANNSRLNSVDIGSVGFWGEWHTFPNDNELMPSTFRRKEIIDLYASSFPNTPLVALAEIFKNAVGGDSEIRDHLYENYAGRFGWRGDSWGGSGHHINDYENIHRENVDLWKTGPVAMEVTGIMSEWSARLNETGYDRVLPLDTTVGDATDWHASLAHNKASTIPSEFIDAPNADTRDLRFMATWMGARLVIDTLRYDSTVSAGAQTEVTSTWRNRGSAPLYRDFRVTYRLRSATGETTVINTDTSLEGLLPTGSDVSSQTSTLHIPASVASGDYTLDVAVAYVDDISLLMPLAVTANVGDDWYEMGPITISGNSLVPEEVEAFGTSTGVTTGSASRLLDMHNEFLLGQNHVWTSYNNNQGSGNANDQLVQTFRFLEPVAANASTVTFEPVSAGTALDYGELVVYRGANNEHFVTRVTGIDGGTATFTPPIRDAQGARTEFWSLYGDGAHPNKVGYLALAEFALGQFTPQEVAAMDNKSHLFLGDSWMEAGPANNPRLADSITALLGGTSSIQATNRAVGGRTSGEVLEKLPADLASAGQTPDYVWLIVGTNDYFQQVEPAEFANNVAKIVNYVEDLGATAIVLNSSVGQLDGTIINPDGSPNPELMLNLSRQYVIAEKLAFEQR